MSSIVRRAGSKILRGVTQIIIEASAGNERARFTADGGLYTKMQRVTPFALTDGANVALDASQSNVFTLTLNGATAQLDNPTNVSAGMSWVVYVTQGAGGGKLLTFDANYSFGDAAAPVLGALAAGAVTVLSMTAVSPTKIAVIANGIITGF